MRDAGSESRKTPQGLQDEKAKRDVSKVRSVGTTQESEILKGFGD